MRRRAIVEPRSGLNPTRNPGCSEFEVDNWEISEFVLRRLVPLVGVRPYPLSELVLMVAAVCRLAPSAVYEWGTHLGASARVFAETARYFGIPATVHTVDLPPTAPRVEHPGSERGLLLVGAEGVVQYDGDGLGVSLELWRAAGSPARPLFFVDGDHAFEAVRKELFTLTGEVGSAALLIHDTFYQSEESGYNVGPHRAVEDLLAANPGRFRRLATETGLPGMTLLLPVQDG